MSTRNNQYLKGPRAGCHCAHPDAKAVHGRLFPRSGVMRGFIGFTKPGESLPALKTSPRWCPLKIQNTQLEVQSDEN